MSTSLTKNTILLYIRITVVTIVTLFSSRFIINGLGEIDYGIFNVIFGIVGLFLIISGAMVVTGNRFLISDMVNHPDKLTSTFSSLFFTHVLLSVVFSIIIEIVGLYMISNQLTIPTDRVSITYVIFHLSVITFLTNMLQIPFLSVIIANENFDLQAYLEIAFAFLLFIVAILIPIMPLDRLLAYSIGYVIAHILIFFCYIIICCRKYEYVTLTINSDLQSIKRILSFASWNFLGSASLATKMQGTNLLLNMFFGPIVNTSRGLAFQVNTALNKLGGTMVTALGPRIIKCYDSYDYIRYNSLIIAGAKYSYQIMLTFSLPLYFAIEYVFQLWLGRVPDYACIFTRLVLIYGLYDTMSLTLRTSAIASKQVKSYYVIISIVEIASLFITYICLKLFAEPTVVFYMYIFTMLLLFLLKLLLLRKTSHLDIKRFILEGIIPCSVATMVHSILILLFFHKTEYSLSSFILLSIYSVLIGAITTFFIVCNNKEQFTIKNYLFLRFRRLNNDKH